MSQTAGKRIEKRETETFMALEVKLQAFEGPLDLLLHLIEKNKVDIYDIPIVEITDQYLETIRQMEEEDMNVMSEFLVMAATLLDIKCVDHQPRNKKKKEQKSPVLPVSLHGANPPILPLCAQAPESCQEQSKDGG